MPDVDQQMAERILEDAEIPSVRDIVQKRVMDNNRALMVQWKHTCMIECVKASAGKDWKPGEVIDLSRQFYLWLFEGWEI